MIFSCFNPSHIFSQWCAEASFPQVHICTDSNSSPQKYAPLSLHWPFSTSARQRKEISHLFSPEQFNACPQKGMSHTNNRRPREEPHSCCCNKFHQTYLYASSQLYQKQQCCPLSLPATYLILFLFHSSVLLSFAPSLFLTWTLGGK